MSFSFDWAPYHDMGVFTPEWYAQQPPSQVKGLWELGRRPEFALWKVNYAHPLHDEPAFTEVRGRMSKHPWRLSGATDNDYASRRSMTRHLSERGLRDGCIYMPLRQGGRTVEKAYCCEQALSVYVSAWREHMRSAVRRSACLKQRRAS